MIQNRHGNNQLQGNGEGDQSGQVTQSGPDLIQMQNQLKAKGIMQTVIDNRNLISTTIDTFRKNPQLISGFTQMFKKSGNPNGAEAQPSPPSKWKLWMIWAFLTFCYYGFKIFIFILIIFRNYGGLFLLFLIAFIIYKTLI
jgi:hypothetical protein